MNWTTNRTAEVLAVAWLVGGLVGGGVGLPAAAVTHVWDGSSSSSFNNSFNWTPFGVPGAGDVGVIGAGPNNAVQLTATTFADDVTLLDGSGASLNTSGFQINLDNATDDATLRIGDGSFLFTTDVVSNPNAPALTSNRVVVEDGGSLSAFGDLFVGRVQIDTGGSVIGGGTVRVNAPTFGSSSSIGLTNNGAISAGFLGPADLTIRASVGTTLDLDGGSGDGVLRATAGPFISGDGASSLTITGELSDAFSGTIEIARADEVRFTQGWEFDGEAIFRGGDGGEAATLSGALLEMTGGTMQVQEGTAVVDAGVEATGGAITVAGGSTLEIRDRIRVLNAAGGSSTLGADATLDTTGTFASPTTLRITDGGTLFVGQPVFDLDGTSGDNVVEVLDDGLLWVENATETGTTGAGFDGSMTLGEDSSLRFNGPMRWNAASTFEKTGSGQRMLFMGETRIDTPVDLDGVGPEQTDIFIGSERNFGASGSLRISVAMEESGTDDFGGRFLVGGTLEVVGPSQSWRLQPGGRLELTVDGGTEAGPNRGGTPVVRSDTITLDGRLAGHGQMEANINARSGSTIEVGEGVRFTGSASRDVADGTGQLTFVGAGLTVNRDATVVLELAGLTRGASSNGHDAIVATGIALNGGELDLSLIRGYEPGMYVEHTLLEETGGSSLNGTFDTVAGVVLHGSLAGTGLAVTYEAGVLIMQRALLGDANLNGQIEQADLDAVLANWGRDNATDFDANVHWATGDYDGDGFVAQADLDTVLANWGSAAPPDFRGSSIPEPAALSVLLTLLVRRRKL